MDYNIPGIGPVSVSDSERNKILAAVMESLDPPRLSVYPPKLKRKLVVLELLAGLFQSGRIYTQTEVNDILSEAWHDPVTLRRDMVEMGWLSRERDGSAYWRTV